MVATAKALSSVVGNIKIALKTRTNAWLTNDFSD